MKKKPPSHAAKKQTQKPQLSEKKPPILDSESTATYKILQRKTTLGRVSESNPMAKTQTAKSGASSKARPRKKIDVAPLAALISAHATKKTSATPSSSSASSVQPPRSPAINAEKKTPPCDTLTATLRDQVDCALRSTTALSQGWEEWARHTTNLLQESLTRSVQISQNIPHIQSVNDLLTLQQNWLRDTVAFWSFGTHRLADILTRTTQQTLEPVTQQTHKALQKIRGV